MKRHSNKNNRRLHLLGALIAVLIIIQTLFTFDFFNLIYAPIIYVICGFCGHYLCEGSKPDFQNPFRSLKCHAKMIQEIVAKKIDL
jgi:hypothetical protein